MKTTIPIAIFSIASVLGGATVVRAQNPVIGHPADPASDSPAQNSQSPASTKPERPPLRSSRRCRPRRCLLLFHDGPPRRAAVRSLRRIRAGHQSHRHLQKGARTGAEFAVIMERLAEIYAKSQQIREAVEEAQRRPEARPGQRRRAPFARAHLRPHARRSGRRRRPRKKIWPRRSKQFQAILKIQPDDAYSALWLARLYRFENQHTDAEKVLRGMLQRDPGNGPALEQLSQLLMDEGRSQEAMKILSDAAGRFLFSRSVRPARRRLLAGKGLSRSRKRPTAKRRMKIPTIPAICTASRRRLMAAK